jgi:hypothetical protein
MDDGELLLQWLKHFSFVKHSQEDKVPLTVDGQCSHKSLNVLSIAKQNGTVMLSTTSLYTLTSTFGCVILWTTEDILQSKRHTEYLVKITIMAFPVTFHFNCPIRKQHSTNTMYYSLILHKPGKQLAL